jgi:hypothetical protein
MPFHRSAGPRALNMAVARNPWGAGGGYGSGAARRSRVGGLYLLQEAGHCDEVVRMPAALLPCTLLLSECAVGV